MRTRRAAPDPATSTSHTSSPSRLAARSPMAVIRSIMAAWGFPGMLLFFRLDNKKVGLRPHFCFGLFFSIHERRRLAIAAGPLLDRFRGKWGPSPRGRPAAEVG